MGYSNIGALPYNYITGRLKLGKDLRQSLPMRELGCGIPLSDPTSSSTRLDFEFVLHSITRRNILTI